MTKHFTLGEKERLKSRKQIDQLFSNGKRLALQPFRVHYSFVSSEFPLQFGVGVSGKNFKKAVDRNRIKRLTREAYRLQKLSLQEKLKAKNQQLVFFVIYVGKDVPDFAFLKEKMSAILNKLISMIE